MKGGYIGLASKELTDKIFGNYNKKNFDDDSIKEEQKPKKESKPKIRQLTKQELEDIKKLKDKIDNNEKEYKLYKETGKLDGKKVSIKKHSEVDNNFLNNRLNWRRQLVILKKKPEVDSYIDEIKQAYKSGEITKEQRDDMIYGTERSLNNELDLYRRNKKRDEDIKSKFNVKKDAYIKKLYNDLNDAVSRGGNPYNQQNYNDIQPALYNNDYEEAERLIKGIFKEIGLPVSDKKGPTKSELKTESAIKRRLERYERNEPKFKEQDIELSKKHKELLKAGKTLSYDKDLGIIMTGKSELGKTKNGKYKVDTELKIKKGLNEKVKKGLKKSIIDELNKNISGSGVRRVDLDYSSDDMYGRGYNSDSSSESDNSSDDEDISQYSKILKHLVGHITDKKEKIDKLDAKQAKEIIGKILKKRIKK